MVDKPRLLIKNLSVQIAGKKFFSQLNLELHSEEVTVLIGENGSGKSTLMDHIAGIRKLDHGTIYLEESNLATMSTKQTSAQIASIGQRDTCPYDILVKNRIAQGLVPIFGPHARLTANVVRKIQTLCQELDIENLMDRPIGKLSSGEKKRVFIARCLINRHARAYLLDEPFANVDLRHVLLLVNILKRRAKQKKIVLVSAHELTVIPMLADRVVALKFGSIVADGTPKEVLTERSIEKIFGVRMQLPMTVN